LVLNVKAINKRFSKYSGLLDLPEKDLYRTLNVVDAITHKRVWVRELLKRCAKKVDRRHVLAIQAWLRNVGYVATTKEGRRTFLEFTDKGAEALSDAVATLEFKRRIAPADISHRIAIRTKKEIEKLTKNSHRSYLELPPEIAFMNPFDEKQKTVIRDGPRPIPERKQIPIMSRLLEYNLLHLLRQCVTNLKSWKEIGNSAILARENPQFKKSSIPQQINKLKRKYPWDNPFGLIAALIISEFSWITTMTTSRVYDAEKILEAIKQRHEELKNELASIGYRPRRSIEIEGSSRRQYFRKSMRHAIPRMDRIVRELKKSLGYSPRTRIETIDEKEKRELTKAEGEYKCYMRLIKAIDRSGSIISVIGKAQNSS